MTPLAGVSGIIVRRSRLFRCLAPAVQRREGRLGIFGLVGINPKRHLTFSAPANNLNQKPLTMNNNTGALFMRHKTLVTLRQTLAGFATIALMIGPALGAQDQSGQSWSVKADYIEACSCHLFCSCYFNTSPEDGMRCVFNNAVKIQEGHVGDTKVDGLKFWVSGDLGGDFTKGMKGAVITVEPGISKQQEEAIKFLIGKIYPVKWGKVEVDHAPITWEKTGMKGHAVLGKGQGEVVLEGVTDSNGEQSVLHNVKYWGAQSNTGFYLAKSTHHYKGHGYDYSLKDRNGFFIHIESSGTT